MSRQLQIKLNFDQDIKAYLSSKYPKIKDFRILSQSLDARGAPRGKKPQYHYVLEVIESGEEFESRNETYKDLGQYFDQRPLIIGAGPAGLFAALRFAEYGIKTTIIERGDEATKRMLHISKYWKKGILNTESNVCYGEGGAGLFSDGKLITRVKSPYIKYVMQKFVEFGAPQEVEYLSNPHLGSNKIRKIITKISDYLRHCGHEIIYNEGVSSLLYDKHKVVGVKLAGGRELLSKRVILATGHSASDIYHHLANHQVSMQAKDFAVGVRIEHPRVVIDELQHGQFYTSEILGAARYRLSYHNEESAKGTYSFCMCPGGYVLSSGTEANGIVVNGMSNYARNSRWSNSALVVTVHKDKDFDKNNVLAGMDFQHEIEQKAYEASKAQADGKQLPAMTVKEFLSHQLNDQPFAKTSSPSGVFKTNIRQLFPEFVNQHLEMGLKEFNKKLKGFAFDDALLIAPETRTSSPVTILRDRKTLESTSHSGLYPCGEGAGYAGGITSAAVDGIKIVEAIIQSRLR